VRIVRAGSFGRLVPEVATPLALVLVELVQNAAEHGLGEAGGTVRVDVRREGAVPSERLVVTVSDDGPGQAAGFDLATDTGGLGLQIVRALVETELGGEMTLLSGGGGARIRVRLPLPAPPFHDHEGSGGL
jgi:two-component sensor histidine kinase